MNDVRKALPPGVNAVDMDARGERSGPVARYGSYGDARSDACVLADIFKAWDVRDVFLCNPAPGGQTPVISRDGGPLFMLKFGDGRWRQASFAGFSGQPWFRCTWEPAYACASGEVSQLTDAVESARRRRAQLAAELARVEADLSRLELRLRETQSA